MKDSESSFYPSRFQSDRTHFNKNGKVEEPTSRERESVSTLPKRQFYESPLKGNRDPKHAAKEKVNLEIGNAVISAQLMSKCISKQVFQSNLKEDI